MVIEIGITFGNPFHCTNRSILPESTQGEMHITHTRHRRGSELCIIQADASVMDLVKSYRVLHTHLRHLVIVDSISVPYSDGWRRGCLTGARLARVKVLTAVLAVYVTSILIRLTSNSLIHSTTTTTTTTMWHATRCLRAGPNANQY